MNIFGIGLPEMALILVVALLVFGPKKLPEIGRSFAQALNSFKKAQQEFETEFKKEADAIQKSMNTPMKATIERPEPKALSPQEEAATSTDGEGASAQDETTVPANADVDLTVLAQALETSDAAIADQAGNTLVADDEKPSPAA